MTEAPVVDRKPTAVEVIEQYLTAYNNHDAAALGKIHHERVKLMDGDEVRVDGRQKLMDLVFASQFANDGRIELLPRLAGLLFSAIEARN
jgi:hypothetical protein